MNQGSTAASHRNAQPRTAAANTACARAPLQMLFLDNEYRNVADVQTLGVVCQHTPDGLTWEVWARGLRAYAKRRAAAAE